MRRFARFAVVISSLCFVPTIDSREWKVSEPRVVLVPSHEDLQRLCGFAGQLYACTAFEESTLSASCVSGQARPWTMIATAIVQPVMYVWDTRWVAHERLHLSDIERSVRLYLEELGRHRFESEGDCRRAADANGGGFAAQMNIFAAASNELRHSKYAAHNHVAPLHQRAPK